jgi:hypothetical protein
MSIEALLQWGYKTTQISHKKKKEKREMKKGPEFYQICVAK